MHQINPAASARHRSRFTTTVECYKSQARLPRRASDQREELAIGSSAPMHSLIPVGLPVTSRTWAMKSSKSPQSSTSHAVRNRESANLKARAPLRSLRASPFRRAQYANPCRLAPWVQLYLEHLDLRARPSSQAWRHTKSPSTITHPVFRRSDLEHNVRTHPSVPFADSRPSLWFIQNPAALPPPFDNAWTAGAEIAPVAHARQIEDGLRKIRRRVSGPIIIAAQEVA